MAAYGLGCVKTKSDLVLMPGGGRIFAFFFALSVATSLEIHGAGPIAAEGQAGGMSAADES
jgi:hypothetical protein